MRALSIIRNSQAIQRLARIKARRFNATRTLPLDNVARSRAQSLLAGIEYLDETTNPGPLSLAQAHDVLRWASVEIPGC